MLKAYYVNSLSIRASQVNIITLECADDYCIYISVCVEKTDRNKKDKKKKEYICAIIILLIVSTINETHKERERTDGLNYILTVTVTTTALYYQRMFKMTVRFPCVCLYF